jgi:ParB family transcriptional regulator, chromosome partitioning protein
MLNLGGKRMMDTQPRLGRGLESLLGGDGNTAVEGVGTRANLAIEMVQANPYQPRKLFDDEDIQNLSQSIKNHGILQPLVVRVNGGTYQLIAGERRLRAAQAAGLREVPVTIVNFDDQQVFEASLVENIQRADLNPIEKAVGFKDYVERYHVGHETLANRLGVERSTVSNLIGLLTLAPKVQEAVRLNQISFGHAKLLKGISSHKRQLELCKETIMKGLSVKALDMTIKQQRAKQIADGVEETIKELQPVPSHKTAHVVSVETELRQRFATRVEIKVRGEDKGQIVISFDNNEEFERVIESLRRSA